MSDWRLEAGALRRNCKDLCISEENAIREMVSRVERLGCHPLLTESINLLDMARERIADWVDRGSPFGDTQCGRCGERAKLPEGGYCQECLDQMIPRGGPLPKGETP